jgi:hypothetical protein
MYNQHPVHFQAAASLLYRTDNNGKALLARKNLGHVWFSLCSFFPMHHKYKQCGNHYLSSRRLEAVLSKPLETYPQKGWKNS